MPTRKQYITMIWMYEKRRKELITKYPGQNRTKKINKKLILWRRAIKRIDHRNDIIQNLIVKINSYFNVDIRSKNINKAHILARGIYLKIGMEMKMNGTNFAKAIGRNNIHTGATIRRTLNKTFKTKPQNKEAYHNFKNYIDNPEKKV